MKENRKMKQMILAVILALTVEVYANPLQKCEAIDKDVLCQCRGYNLTHFPNDRFSSQSGAKIQFSQFQNLIRTNCSPYLIDFLCSRYFPPCSPHWRKFNYILPCRELCEKVKKDCEPVLRRYNAQWSQDLACDGFKSVNDTQPNSPPCIDTKTLSTASTKMVCENKEKCVDIEHPKGRSAKYKTFFPNAVTNSQTNASQRLSNVLKNKCSLETEQFFIISHYPPCSVVNNTVKLVYPCKQLCRRIKKACEKKMNGKVVWPKYMDCRRLSKNLCVNDLSKYFAKPSPTPTTPKPVSTPTPKPLVSCKQFIETSCGEMNKFSDLPKVKFSKYDSKFAKYVKLLNTNCSVWLKPFLCYEAFSAHTSTGKVERVKPCRNVCRKAEKECSACFTKHGLSWSDQWKCQDFQVKKNCIGINELTSYTSSNNNVVSACPIVKDKVCTP